MPAASRTVVIDAPMEKAFDAICAYERYPEFLPEVKGVRILKRNGSEVDVRYEVELIKKLHYTLRMKEQRPSDITWSFLEGEILKDNQGFWRLEPVAGGKTQATYSVDIDVGPWVPKTVVHALVESSLPRMLQAFAKRIESAP